jgi:hypothetical protein
MQTFSKIFDLQVVRSADVELTDVESQPNEF